MRDREAAIGEFAAELSVERERLVRLCARLAGNWDIAEDLAQETLLEAWRLRGKLRDVDGLTPWLAAIASYVCRRYTHGQRRALARHVRSTSGEEGAKEGAWELLEELPAGDEGPTIVLERGEVAALLDQALALIPIETRRAMLACYVHELPQAEVAARLGMSEGALRVRLHRGKLALRQVFATELREDAMALGIATATIGEAAEAVVWNETRIWCPFCGRHRLACYMNRRTGTYAFRCAVACLPHGSIVASGRNPALLAALASPKAILARLCVDLSLAYRRAMTHGGLEYGGEVCPFCGGSIVDRRSPPDPSLGTDGPPIPSAASGRMYGIWYACSSCGRRGGASAWHLALDTPTAMRFWRRHPRMRALPIRELAFDGRPALLTGFESCDGNARLELVSARDTYEVLRVEGEGTR